MVVYGCGRNVPVTMVKRSCGMITIGKLMDYYGKRAKEGEDERQRKQGEGKARKRGATWGFAIVISVL